MLILYVCWCIVLQVLGAFVGQASSDFYKDSAVLTGTVRKSVKAENQGNFLLIRVCLLMGFAYPSDCQRFARGCYRNQDAFRTEILPLLRFRIVG